jgi:ribonuclease BN (tRNA processing enzyme)
MTSRRKIMKALAAIGFVALLPLDAGAQPNGSAKLILMGTKGGPAVRDITQVPSSNVIIIGKDSYVVDVGYGATMRLVEKKVPLASIRSIFITHHHSDHNLEAGPLLYSTWTGQMTQPVSVYGPEGVQNLIASSLKSNEFDLTTRMADEGRPDLRKMVNVHQYAEGLVMENEQMRVTALRNLHPPITESYALRFEIKSGKTIVFSGDTAYFPPLAKFAEGADYLVHEVMYVPALEQIIKGSNAKSLLKHLMDSHTSTEDVGRIASAAGVKNLVLTHFVPGGIPTLTDQNWLEGVRKNFNGNVIVGRDQLEIPLQ